MKCRDDRLHEAKYLKERMELELRIREQIIIRGTQTAEQTTSDSATPATVDAPLLPNNAGKDGEPVLQPELNLGRNSGFAEPNRISTETKSTDKNADEQPVHEARTGENQSEPIADTADLVTGWEVERDIFFNPEMAFTEGEIQPDVVAPNPNLSGIMGDVVRLGKSIEHLGDVPPVKDSTTNPAVKERKKAVGQKKDDNSGHDFEMTM